MGVARNVSDEGGESVLPEVHGDAGRAHRDSAEQPNGPGLFGREKAVPPIFEAPQRLRVASIVVLKQGAAGLRAGAWEIST